MSIQNILSFIVCFTIIFSLVGCNKSNDTTMSAINSDTISSIGSNIVSTTTSTVASTEQSSSQQAPTSNDTSSTQANDATTSLNDEYGFSSIIDIKYKCLKDLPSGDAQYQLDTVITDTGTALDYMFDLSCKEKSITIDNLVVTIPFEYRQSHDSVTVTATHRFAKISGDFVIKFDKWELVFEDDFDGTELNTDVWNVWDEKRDWRYSYSKDAMFLDGKGNLINRMSILDTPDSSTGETRISGAITTKGKYETTYGYFEVRMIPHKTAGLMGAFWLMCGDMGDTDAADDGTAVNGCEVDIIETFYHNLNPSQTIHWDGYTYTKSKSFNKQGSENIFDGNYHTFAFLWTPDEYVFFIDGEVNARTGEMGICNQPGYLLISSHFNDNAGEFIGTQTDMTVDYVRVYKTSTKPI